MIGRDEIRSCTERFDGARWVMHGRDRRSFLRSGSGAGEDSRRAGRSSTTAVELFRPRPEGLWGSATVNVDPSWTAARLTAEFDQAWEATALTAVPARPLPPAVLELPEVALLDEGLSRAPDAALDEMELAIFERFAKQPHLRLGFWEIRAEIETEELRADGGLAVEQEGSRLSLWVIALAGEGEEARDWRLEFRRRRVSELIEALTDAVEDVAREARDRPAAVLPRSRDGVSLVFTGTHLPNFFMPLVWHASAEAAARNLSRLRPEEPLTPAWAGGGGPRLVADALHPRGLGSRRFDADGVPGSRVPFVEGGRLLRWLAPLDRAEALGVAPSGRPTNLVVEGEGEPFEDLLRGDGPILWVTAFSEFRPSPVTGQLSGEIRFGYEIEGGRRKPVAGGAVSLSVFDALESLRMSREQRGDGLYFGPSALRVEGVSVAGEG